MRTTMLIKLSVPLVTLFLTFLQVQGEESQIQDPRFRTFYREIETLVNRHYPEATCHLSGNIVSFSFDTQPFLVHFPLKTGEWQEAREVKGPKQKGILGSVELRKGRFGGAAMLPQTFDTYYFSDMASAPYSAACDSHLYVHLLVPRFGRNNEFVKEFHDLVNNVERWQECNPKIELNPEVAKDHAKRFNKGTSGE
jgi:hypothetical protein